MTDAADVVIVGGGVIGSAVAFELVQRQMRVVLIDKGLPGRATSASAGGLWPLGEAVGLGCGVIYQKSRSNEEGTVGLHPGVLPQEFQHFLVRSNSLFPELALRLRECSGVDIEYEPGTGLIFLIYEEAERHWVKELRASVPMADGVELLTPAEVHRIEPHLTSDLLGAALLSGEYQVNPMALAEGLKRAAIQGGAEFRPDTIVRHLERRGDRITGVVLDNDRISCHTVVNAAGAWAGQLAASVDIDLPIIPVRGQVVLTVGLPSTLRGCLSTSACYLAQKAHGEVLIGSTTEKVGFDVSVTSQAITSMCRGAVRAVPMLRRVGVKRVWAGLRPGTPDELPILGGVPQVTGYCNATGGFRTGIVASPLTGRIVAQSIVGETSDVPLDPYLCKRFSNRSDFADL